MPLEPFDELAVCRKCDGPDVSMTYCKDHHATAEFGYDVEIEHLHRQCQRCGYVWVQACKDYTEGQEAT